MIPPLKAQGHFAKRHLAGRTFVFSFLQRLILANARFGKELLPAEYSLAKLPPFKITFYKIALKIASWKIALQEIAHMENYSFAKMRIC